MSNSLLQLALVMNLIDKTSSPLRTVAGSADKTGKAVDKATKAVKNLESASSKLAKKSMAIIAYGSAWEGFANSIADKFKKPVDAYARLENGMSALKVAMMDSTGAVSGKFKELSDLAVDLSNKLPTTAEEMHKVAAAGIAMGMNEDVMINGGLQAASNFAMAAMGGDFNRSMEITNALQKSWKIDSGDLGKSLDLMARAQSVGVNTEDMLKALAKTGLQAQGRGETGFTNLEKMMPYLTTILADGTMSGDVVGTNFSKMMSKALTADTSKVDKAAGTKLGLEFVKDGKFAGLKNMVDQLQKLSKLDASKQAAAINQLFGDSVELQSIVFKLISEGNTGVKNMEKTMQKFASIQNKVEAGTGTLSAKWNAFTGTLDTSLGKLTEPLDGILKAIVDNLNAAAAALGDFAKNNQNFVKILGSGVLTFGLAIFAIGKLIMFIGAFGIYLSGFLKAWETLSFGLFAVKYYVVTGLIPALQKVWASLITKVIPSIWSAITASKAFAVKLFTVHIPAVFSAIAAHGLFALAVAGAVIGIAGLVYAIFNLMDGTTEAGNDLRVLVSGFDGLWAVLKKIAGFLIYFVSFGNYIPEWAANAEADADTIARENSIGRYAATAQPPAPATGGDTNNNVEGDTIYNQTFNIDAKNTDFKQILKELKEMQRLDNSRKYAVAK